MDHAGLPLKTVLEQLDLLGDVVPVPRRELDALRPASVPDGPGHETLVAASLAELAAAGTDHPATAGPDVPVADRPAADSAPTSAEAEGGPELEASRR